VKALAEAGHVTGASHRNWNSYGSLVDLDGLGATERALLTDPQTSGGLLVTCDPSVTGDVLDIFRSEGFDRAAVIGEVSTGTPGISVR
jgi:selenide,water dikinase